MIKHSLPAEALESAPPPHNVIVSYSKPRVLVEVEVTRLPLVKIAPETYAQVTAGGQEQLAEHPAFQHEQDYFTDDSATSASQRANNNIDWRI